MKTLTQFIEQSPNSSSLNEYILESKDRKFEGVSVNNFFIWYTGSKEWATDKEVLDDFEDNDMFYDLVPDKFKTYKDLIKFLKDHEADQITLHQHDLGNTLSMQFEIDGVKFDVDSVDEYMKYKNR